MRRGTYFAFAGGWAIALAGYWLPWLAPRQAALRLNGYELAEWITRLPGVRDGSLSTRPLHLLAPLAGLALLGGLLIGLEPGLRASLRLSVTVISALNILLLFPGYPSILRVFDDPEPRTQAALGAGAVVLLGLCLFLAPRLSRRGISALAAVLAAGSGGLALWSFAVLRPELTGLLPELASAGAGLYLLTGGCLAIGLAGLAGAVKRTGEERKNAGPEPIWKY